MGTVLPRLALLLALVSAAFAEAPPPTSIYFVARASSDVLGAAGDYILDLRKQDGAVLVRWARVEQATTFCSRPIVVKAHEQRMELEAYEALFSESNPCDVEPKSVEGAMRYRGQIDLMEHPVDVTLVAACGDERRVLRFPPLPGGRRPRNRKVAKLQVMNGDIVRQVFPLGTDFRSFDPDVDFKLQEDAVGVVADMRAGKLDFVWINGESGGWGYALDSYEGPIRTERLLVVKLLPTDLEFKNFATPRYPPLAISARIQGTVRLSLEFTADGSVSAVTVLEGHGLLASAAEKAAASWRVDPAGVPSEATEVGISFELKCAVD
jgi:TonB family protein